MYIIIQIYTREVVKEGKQKFVKPFFARIDSSIKLNQVFDLLKMSIFAVILLYHFVTDYYYY